MIYKHKYNPEHLHYMKEQIWESKDDLSVYDRLSEFEYEQTKDYMKPPNHKIWSYNVLDLGCGLGRFSIYLNQIWKDKEVHYTLTDTTGDTENHGGWNLDEYYNNLDLTYSFCKLNELENFEIIDTKKDKYLATLEQDLIFSHCAFGMHYPIEDVMSKLLQVSSPEVTMIFGTRKRDLYTEDSFKEFFHEVKFLKQEHIPPFPHQDWLILRGKK